MWHQQTRPLQKNPPFFACFINNDKVVKLLLDKGTKVNLSDKYNRPPLSVACKNGNFEIAKMLIDKEADVRAVDFEGSNPLHHAAFGGNKKIVKLLIRDKRVDLLKTDNNGKTPADIAKEENHNDIVEILSLLKNKNKKPYGWTVSLNKNVDCFINYSFIDFI